MARHRAVRTAVVSGPSTCSSVTRVGLSGGLFLRWGLEGPEATIGITDVISLVP
jgi:hypothetical protein